MKHIPKHSLHRGMRVAVTMGDGRLEYGAVQHWRWAPPDYTTLEAVSVLLDSRLYEHRYRGTTVRAGQVAPIDASAGAGT